MEDVKATVALYEKLTEKFYKDETFQAFPLIYQVKRQSPASKAQKERLYKLIDKHKLVLNEDVDRLTRNEASRLTDKIILKYGRW